MTVRTRLTVTLIALAVLASGCRIDVGAAVKVERNGRGEVAVSVRVDGATLRELDRTGIDPGLDVTLGLGAGTAWRTQREVDPDGGLVLTYQQAFTDGEGATALLRELFDDVDAQDPALRLDVTVTTSTAGAVRLEGTGALVPPATLGVTVDGQPAGPSGEELAALTAEAVRVELSVRVPGRIVTHDADRIDGSTLRWVLPVGEPRDLLLVSDPVPLWRRFPAWPVPLLLAAVVVAVLRRRRDGAGDGAGDGTGDSAGDSAGDSRADGGGDGSAEVSPAG